MEHRSCRDAPASLRGGGRLFLLDADGHVLAEQREAYDERYSPMLPFGLQRLVNAIIGESWQRFAAGNADITVDFPLVVRLFSVQRKSQPSIALYVSTLRETD